MPQLRYVDDDGRLHTIVLSKVPFVIGRVMTCHLVLDDDKVSREHARIEKAGDSRFEIRDLGSRNKTLVNGQQINETLLTSGDMIRIGDRVVEFLDDRPGTGRITLDFLTPDRHEPDGSEWIKLKAPLSVTTMQLEQLARLAGAHAMTARPADVASTALGQIMIDMQADRGFIALRGDAKMELHPIAHRSLKAATGTTLTPVSQAFVFHAVLQASAGRYPDTSGKIDLKAGYAATGLVAPLTANGEVVGVLYVDRPIGKKPFPPASLQYIAAAGAQLGSLLAESSRRLSRATIPESAAWVTTLRRLQRSMATAVESSDAFAVASVCEPGSVRCGDLCDVIHVDEHRCAIVLVDGGGHGVAGLAQGGAIRSAIRAAIACNDEALLEPVPIFSALNETIASSPSRQVLPCTYLGIDLTSGRLAYINAGGLPPMLMVAPGRLVTLDQPSLVLGVDKSYTYETMRADLPESFRLVCHTNGLPEAYNAASESLGEQRVHDALLAREAFGSAEAVVALLRKLLADHLSGAPLADDALMTVVARG